MQSLISVSCLLVFLANALPHNGAVVRHKHLGRNVLDDETPFPLPNASLPVPYVSGSSGLASAATGLYSVARVTAPSSGSVTAPLPLGTGTGISTHSTTPGIAPRHTFVPTSASTTHSFSLLLPPLPTHTTATPTPHCDIGAIQCSGRQDYSLCVPGSRLASRSADPENVEAVSNDAKEDASDWTQGLVRVKHDDNANLKPSWAALPAGNYFKSMGRVPHGSECVDNAIQGFTGEQCKNDEKIRCQGGETGWSICVGGYWKDLGDLPGKDACVNGSILGPLQDQRESDMQD